MSASTHYISLRALLLGVMPPNSEHCPDRFMRLFLDLTFIINREVHGALFFFFYPCFRRSKSASKGLSQSIQHTMEKQCNSFGKEREAGEENKQAAFIKVSSLNFELKVISMRYKTHYQPVEASLRVFSTAEGFHL